MAARQLREARRHHHHSLWRHDPALPAEERGRGARPCRDQRAQRSIALTEVRAGDCMRGFGRSVLHSQPSQKTRRSEEHTSELQSLMRISYAVFCLKKKNNTDINKNTIHRKTNENKTTRN